MRRRAVDLVEATGWPMIVVDPALVDTWRDLPHERSIRPVIERAWRLRSHVAWETSDPESLDRLARAARLAGEAIIVIDELRPFASSSAVGTELVILARQHRHSGVHLLMGTQCIADVRTDLLAAVGVLWHGRITAPRLLDFLHREYGLDPAELQKLGRGEFVRTALGFEREAKDPA
jgi:hypothetical protein